MRLPCAWVKGIRTFDPNEALKAYHHEATNKGPWGPANGRDGWKEYFTLGYVPYPKYREATAKTLEYAYDDFCGYQLAQLTNNKFYKETFARQMFNYKNVYDPSTRFMRGRQLNGDWVANFDPIEWGRAFHRRQCLALSVVGFSGCSGTDKFNGWREKFYFQTRFCVFHSKYI